MGTSTFLKILLSTAVAGFPIFGCLYVASLTPQLEGSYVVIALVILFLVITGFAFLAHIIFLQPFIKNGQVLEVVHIIPDTEVPPNGVALLATWVETIQITSPKFKAWAIPLSCLPERENTQVGSHVVSLPNDRWAAIKPLKDDPVFGIPANSPPG